MNWMEEKIEENSPEGIKYVKKEDDNVGLANGMLLHNDHNSKRSSLTAPTVLRYPRGG